ncbi:MAG: hypothetical protein JWL93_912 [Hyphomicrobiales bacterium]|nr:hypothetical protein [Hyphomicrobiales bacterium]
MMRHLSRGRSEDTTATPAIIAMRARLRPVGGMTDYAVSLPEAT